MKAKHLKEKIQSCTCDICFEYEGKSACINPWNQQKYEVGFGDEVEIFNDIDILMSTNLFNGKSLNQICTSLNVEFV